MSRQKKACLLTQPLIKYNKMPVEILKSSKPFKYVFEGLLTRTYFVFLFIYLFF